ncbi:unnamed protein product [Vitrella brassicaformis CCMP3155]|uniref:Uncharacterized protein n=1 Tax=Vitrella brassicaformis (strain CCMP3155) TaxID=1169540 RepID=A0A0G4GIS8_VITBC|nr:unnamed protein product [Vitrella brassicaformis CCMP3155]|eukprot:CEM29605.1 unnamed protein product [Vitrella brassicaformis CCMP3155]
MPLFRHAESREPSRYHKQGLVSKVLCRWWYVMPEWPPEDFDNDGELRKQKLRRVEIDKWRDTPKSTKSHTTEVVSATPVVGSSMCVRVRAARVTAT